VTRILPPDDEDEYRSTFKLRGRQPEWVDKIEADLENYSRLLVVAPGGVGKTEIMAAISDRAWRNRGQRSLVLENRDRLTEQTAARIESRTGLNVDIEMGAQRASPFAEIVVGTTQSVGIRNRLTGFDPNHFGIVIPDECHFCLAPQPQRILNYFHYGSESLEESWVKPEHGLYVPRASVIGFTASPNLGSRRNLGEFFQHKSVDYSYMDAIEEGWLVGIVEENIPVKIDTRNFRIKRNSEGSAFNTVDQNAALLPVMKLLAQQIIEYASDKKTICFLPSVECSRVMAEILNASGLRAIFVSGECLDKNEKTDEFQAAGPGTVLVNCALYIYGVDFQDVTCVAIFSAVISIVNYIQKVYRGTRVLPGIVNDDMTAEERRFAIAHSNKPHLTLLSPFFISDRIDICSPCNLFTDNPEVAKKMKDYSELGFAEAAKSAERDYAKMLEKAAKKTEGKLRRTINPVAFAVAIHDDKLASYVPVEEWEKKAPSEAQIALLVNLKWPDITKITTAGLAQKLTGILLERKDRSLASPGQLQFLAQLGHHDAQVATWSAKKAGFMISRGPVRQQSHA
jgi:superfamily II DNA or RNA helicase